LVDMPVAGRCSCRKLTHGFNIHHLPPDSSRNGYQKVSPSNIVPASCQLGSVSRASGLDRKN
jgi:hypothetical protein